MPQFFSHQLDAQLLGGKFAFGAFALDEENARAVGGDDEVRHSKCGARLVRHARMKAQPAAGFAVFQNLVV